MNGLGLKAVNQVLLSGGGRRGRPPDEGWTSQLTASQRMTDSLQDKLDYVGTPPHHHHHPAAGKGRSFTGSPMVVRLAHKQGTSGQNAKTSRSTLEVVKFNKPNTAKLLQSVGIVSASR